MNMKVFSDQWSVVSGSPAMAMRGFGARSADALTPALRPGLNGGNQESQIENRKSALATGHWPLATRRGFSLVEVLLAIFILGIGMIMVASVFPVGANWTRQTAEGSVSQTIAQSAMSV